MNGKNRLWGNLNLKCKEKNTAVSLGLLSFLLDSHLVLIAHYNARNVFQSAITRLFSSWLFSISLVNVSADVQYIWFYTNAEEVVEQMMSRFIGLSYW